MKLSVCGCAEAGEKEQFIFLKDCGFDACDFSLGKYFSRDGMFGDLSKLTDDMIKEHFTMLRKEAEKVGFEIGQTHSATTSNPKQFDYDYEEMAARQIASIKATHYLGCKYCVIHPIIFPDRKYDYRVEENFQKTVEFYAMLTPTLEKYDVYCCVENMFHSDSVYKHICTTIFSHCSEMVRACEILGDRFKICVDVGHAPLTQDNPAEMVRIAGDRLAVLHTHDNDGMFDLHTFPFSVHKAKKVLAPMRIDWDDFMKALDDVGYKGNLSFEISPPGPLPVKRAGYVYLAKLGRYLASLREN